MNELSPGQTWKERSSSLSWEISFPSRKCTTVRSLHVSLSSWWPFHDNSSTQNIIEPGSQTNFSFLLLITSSVHLELRNLRSYQVRGLTRIRGLLLFPLLRTVRRPRRHDPTVVMVVMVSIRVAGLGVRVYRRERRYSGARWYGSMGRVDGGRHDVLGVGSRRDSRWPAQAQLLVQCINVRGRGNVVFVVAGAPINSYSYRYAEAGEEMSILR